MDKEKLKKSIDNFIRKEREDEKSKNTIKHYQHILYMLLTYLDEGKEMEKTDLIEFKEYLLNAGFAPSTIQNYITVINKWLKYAKKKKMIVKNIKVQEQASLNEDELITPEDFNRLLKRAKSMKMSEYYMIMKVLGYTGIRISELQYFTVENLNKSKLTVKNKGKIRTVILRTDLKKELKKYAKDRGIESGYLFPGKKEGTMIHHSTIYKNMKLIASAESVKKSRVHPHAFRHLFSIKYLEEGGQPSDLKDILGHSRLETTAIYTRTTDKMKKVQIERMKY